MIMILFGKNGVGKSSLMNYFLNESAFDYQRIKKGQVALSLLKEEKNINVLQPRHFTFVNGSATFRKFGCSKRKSFDLNPEALGIQSEAPEGVVCQFIPEYSTLGIDEAQTWFSSREGHVQNYQFSFFEKHRHNNLDIFLSTTRAKLIDLRIRALSSGFFIKERKVNINQYGEYSIVWKGDFIDVGDIDDYLSASPSEKNRYSIPKMYCANYNVFDIYNPEEHKHLFSDNFKNFNLLYGE